LQDGKHGQWIGSIRTFCRSVLLFEPEDRYHHCAFEVAMTPIVNSPLWPVPITTVGRSRGGSIVFTRGGKLHVTCFLKSTFQFVPDHRMALAQPEDIVLADTAYSDAPESSIWAPRETVPFLPRVDVLLTGHTCAPVGQMVSSQSVRLAIHREGGLLLDKTLHVYGDRNDPTIASFDKMPVVYERAYGGIGYAPNPHGTGVSPGSPYPNIVHPLDASMPAGFGPLSHEMRMARLGPVEHPRFIDEQVLELPASFNEAYFQSAPADQLLDSLEGSEWIEIDGMHPKHPRMISRLPGIKAVGKVYGVYPEKPDGVRTISLRPDILRIDADTLHCSVVFRATIGLRDGRSLQTLRIAAGVETEEVSIAHLLTAPPMRGAEPPAESVRPPPPDFEDGDRTGQFMPQANIAMPNARASISDEATIVRSIDSFPARNIKPARISTPELFIDDDTVTSDRRLTRSEMDRLAALAVQFNQITSREPNTVSDERSTLALDIDFSDFDSL
jgi:hypothetical protein